MEVPGVSDNVQVSERVLFASWHCGVFGTTAPAILTGCYRLCLISTPPGLMPDNCSRAIAASTPSGGSFSSAHEPLRLYFAKMEPRMFATVFETFRHNALTSQKGSL